MSFDVSKYAKKIQNAQSSRVDRDFIQEGDHVVRIEGVVSMTSDNTGNDLVILEGEIVSTTNIEEHRSGDKVKQIFSLSGVPAWKVDEYIGKLKTIVLACLPEGTKLTQKEISNALQGGADSAIAGDCIRIIAKKKVSKKGAEFLSFSYVRVAEEIAQGWTVENTIKDPNDAIEGGEPVEGEGNDDDMPF
jgi:hypothetical protein